MRPIKCVIVGNRKVGKSSLAHTFVYQKFIESPWFLNYQHLTKVTTTTCPNGPEVKFLICDIVGSKEYEKNKRKCYARVDVVVLCFSVEKRIDLSDIHLHWQAEIRDCCPAAVPIILVATKIDLRGDFLRPVRHVTYRQGRELSKQIGAMEYIECSTLDVNEVSTVFTTAATCGFNYRSAQRSGRKKRHKCTIM